ncbi:MAG: error-prone DNA polymerase [Candidatus Limnocylindria bacterium]|nr:error-prone DNA polymerase [Candidatus Limnocylindria bacterium]
MSGSGGYVELHCHSHYSFLDGASSVDDLVDAAVRNGMDALALTDTNGLYGAVRFWNAARERGIKPIFGVDLRLLDLGSLVLLAEGRTGWTSLCRIVSAAQLAGEKTKPRATFDLVAANAEGLVALTGDERGALPAAVRAGDLDAARLHLARLAGVFGERLFVELADHLGPDDPALCDALAALAAERGLGTVVTNDVRFARPEGRRLHDVLRAIDLGVTLDEAGERLSANGERWLKDGASLRALLGRHGEAFANARAIADRCTLDLAEVGPGGARALGSMVGRERLPGFPAPAGHTAFSFLHELCQAGTREKYGRMTRRVSSQLAHELEVIDRCGLAEFFLINWDIVRFCRERRIPAQGRGSAADSIAAYVLDITKVDPIAHDLLFERFLTEDATTMPDIDLDIASNDREEVIQYVYGKYGERFAAMVCNVVTYRTRSAHREVAKALGFRPATIDAIARSIDTVAADPRLEQPAAETDAPGLELDERERARWPVFREIVAAIADFPRHLSIHNGGMLITALPLVDTVPIERATMPGRNVVQFDKRDVEDLGLVKMDLLGLRTLSLVKDAVADIEARHGARLELGTIGLDDPAVYDLLCEVDTIGLFQVESRAQAQALPRVRPRCFADIVVEVAIIRPGPLQGNMVNPYIRRRQGREPVAYAHPLLEPILRETLGVILFQEQILRVAMAVAGFTPAAADKLRRAMSRARSAADMERLRLPFVTGALTKGVGEPVAQEVFRQIAAFAEFGFCKSHAAAFALTAYHTAHLKLYYPAEFTVALLNNQPMGFYSPAVIAGDAKRHGIRVLPVDVNASAAGCVVEAAGTSAERDVSTTIARHRVCRAHDVRLGLRSVRALGDAAADAIVAERVARGPFRSFDDVVARVPLTEEALRNLALVGAFDAFAEPRRALLWRARGAHRGSPHFVRPTLAFAALPAPALPALPERERVALDYRVTGIPTGPQIMHFLRDGLVRRGVLRAVDLAGRAHGTVVRVAGAVVVKQHPQTAKGHVFLSLEDETGIANVIIRPATYAACKPVLDRSAAVVVEGALQHQDGVVSVLARCLEGLDLACAEGPAGSPRTSVPRT